MKTIIKIGYCRITCSGGLNEMILCVCRGVSELQVVDAIRGGARSLDDVTRHCDGAGTDCGSCRCDIEELLGCDRLRVSA